MTALLADPAAHAPRRPVDVPIRVSWRLSASGLVTACTVLPRAGAARLQVRTSTGRWEHAVPGLGPSSQLVPVDDGSVVICHHRLGAHQVVRVTPGGRVHPVATSSAQALFLAALPDGDVLAVEALRSSGAAAAGWVSRLSTVAPGGLEHVATVDAKVLGVVALADRLAVNVAVDGQVRALGIEPATGFTEELFAVSARSDDRIVDYLPATRQVVVSTDASGEARLGLGRDRLRFPDSLRAPAGVTHLAATADGAVLAVAMEAGATSRIRLVDTTTHAGTDPDLPPLVVLGQGAFAGRELVVPVSTPDRPGTLLRLDAATGRYSFDDPAEPVGARVRLESLPGASGPVESLVIGDPATASTLVVALHGGPLDSWRAMFDGSTSSDPVPPTRLRVPVSTRSGEPLALISTDPGLRQQDTLLRSAVAVSQLALENARLEAQLRFQLAETQQARARLLRSGLEQRRQLERDLHDGAQQHLLAVAMRLGAAEALTDDPTTAEAVRMARKELADALAELRDLARGIYPAELSQSGLRAALETVTARLPIVVYADVPDRRWPADVESAAYFLACEGLTNAAKHAAPCTAWLTIHHDQDDLVVTVRDNGPGSDNLNTPDALPTLRDRMGALGGTLTVHSTSHGTTLAGKIPCA